MSSNPILNVGHRRLLRSVEFVDHSALVKEHDRRQADDSKVSVQAWIF